MFGSLYVISRHLGAAILTAALATSVSAKDVPRPKRDEPTKRTGCEYLGQGFIKAEGTDTCIKVGGSVSATASWSSGR